MVADNVFSPSFGNRPSYLVGREPLLRDLLSGLSSPAGSRNRAVLLLGQRGSGKTVLLWEIADRASKAGFVVAAPTVASEGMLGRIVEKIQDAGEQYVKQRSTHVSGGSLGALGFSAGLQFSRDVQETKSFQYKLAHLVRALNKREHGVLVLVDELQANSDEVRQLVIAYQELVGEGCDIALIMAGLPAAVSATLNDRVLTFLNRARKTTVGPLRLADVDAFFARAFSDLGIRIDSDVRREAARATQGSPYMLQLVGYNLALYASEGEITQAVFDDALTTARIDFENDVCQTSLVALSDKDVEFLRAMTRDEEASRMADVAQRMGVSPDYAQKYRKRLLDAGMIEQAGRGRVTFAVPYLQEHLRNNAY